MTKKTSLIAYCGLYCATCPAYTQVVADLAKDLRVELKKGKFDKVADFLAKMPAFNAFKHYEQGYELLGAMTKMRCKSCKSGGGWSGCKIRKCAKQKELAGCWQCDEFETCGKLKILEESGDTTYLKNLRKIRRWGTERFVKTRN
jgi:hypothetical protein